MAILNQGITVIVFGYLYPLVSAEDSAEIESSYETESAITELGKSSFFDKLKTATITCKLVRGDNITGGGVMSTNLIPKSEFKKLMMPGNYADVAVFINGTGRKWQGKCKVAPFDKISSSAASQIITKFLPVDSLAFHNNLFS